LPQRGEGTGFFVYSRREKSATLRERNKQGEELRSSPKEGESTSGVHGNETKRRKPSLTLQNIAVKEVEINFIIITI